MVLPDTRVGGNHFVFVLSVNVHMIFATRICKVGCVVSKCWTGCVHITHMARRWWQQSTGTGIQRYPGSIVLNKY